MVKRRYRAWKEGAKSQHSKWHNIDRQTNISKGDGKNIRPFSIQSVRNQSINIDKENQEKVRTARTKLQKKGLLVCITLVILATNNYTESICRQEKTKLWRSAQTILNHLTPIAITAVISQTTTVYAHLNY
jgi:hypothetical protein